MVRPANLRKKAAPRAGKVRVANVRYSNIRTKPNEGDARGQLPKDQI